MSDERKIIDLDRLSRFKDNMDQEIAGQTPAISDNKLTIGSSATPIAQDIVNVNDINGVPTTAYASADAARAAVDASSGLRIQGQIITYLLADGWYTDQYIGSATDSTSWGTASNWKTLGPVSVSQNIETGHTDINIGSDSYPVASVEEVSQLGQAVFGYEEENTLATVAGSVYTNVLILAKTIPSGSNVKIYLEGTDGTFNGSCQLTSNGFETNYIAINESKNITTTAPLTYIQVQRSAANVLLSADTTLKLRVLGSLSDEVDKVETAFNEYIQRANDSYNAVSTRGYIDFDNANGKLVLNQAVHFSRNNTLLNISAGQYDMDLSETALGEATNYCVLVINSNNVFGFRAISKLRSTDLIFATVVKNTDTSISKVVNCVIPYKINGEDDITSIKSDISTLYEQVQAKADLGNDLYPYKNTIIGQSGTTAPATGYMCSDFLPIDKSDKIEIKGSQATSMQLCTFYKKDGTRIASYKEILAARGVTINTGNNVQYTIPTSDIPEDAYYVRCCAHMTTGGYIKNNGLSLLYLIAILKSQNEDIIELNENIENIENINVLNNKASILESVWKCREQYLRDLFINGNESEHWYGVEWAEENNPNNVTAINSTGDGGLHTTLPIQSKMRRCVVKDGIVQYYLHSDNSELKEDGTAAKLDGTDGDVMVEIPEFFYRFEEETVNNIRTLRVKISEQGLTGFIYSPKRYTSAYEATINRTTNKFASVCTTNFARNSQEVTIKSQSNYTEGSGYSLGTKSIALRNGFTANAANYRGGTNNNTFDSANDPTINPNMDAEYHTFARNQLGIPVANINRTDCRNYADLDNGIFIHQYDTVKILWLLSIVEFKTRNIQNSALGSGAVVYPNYNAYESFFKPLRGISCIPCGVTNSLGNHSGEVYYKMQDVPVGSTGYGDEIVYSEWNNVWMPCMSYRGVENFYGHIYKIVDQLNIVCTFTGNYVEGHGGDANWGIYNVNYYYTKNPYLCNDEVPQDKLLSSVTFASGTRTISSILGTSQGHILPIKTDENNLGYEYNYCDCCEIYARTGVIYPTFNGRIVSGGLVGSNFIVGADSVTQGTTRPSDGTRIDMFI